METMEISKTYLSVYVSVRESGGDKVIVLLFPCARCAVPSTNTTFSETARCLEYRVLTDHE